MYQNILFLVEDLNLDWIIKKRIEIKLLQTIVFSKASFFFFDFFNLIIFLIKFN
jgi:hypothetical protein